MVLLQVALDTLDLEYAVRVARACVDEGFDIVEAGTPLIKRFGVEALRVLRKKALPPKLLADMKTVDAAEVEVRLVKEFGGDAITVMGLAPVETIEACIAAARELGVEVVVDLMGVSNPLGLLYSLSQLPDAVCLHVGLDVQRRRGISAEALVEEVREIRRRLPKEVLVAVAGGLTPEKALPLIEAGADVLIAGGAILRTTSPRAAARRFVEVCKLV